MPKSLNECKYDLQQKNSKELLNILKREQWNYDTETIDFIKQELLHRGISQNDVEFASETYFKAVERERTQSKSSNTKWLKYVALLIGLAFTNGIIKTCNRSAKSESWDNLKSEIMANTRMFPDKESREKFSDCVVAKLKNKYPNGATGLTQDQVNQASREYGSECSVELKGDVKFHLDWNPNTEKQMRDYLMGSTFLSTIENPDTKSKFCDCFLANLKQRYPNGLDKMVSQQLADSISYDCKNQMTK